MKRAVTILLLILGAATALYGANIEFPSFYLRTRGALTGGAFPLQTQADITLRFGGGFKLGGQLSLSLSDNNLETDPSLGSVYDADNVQAALDRALRFHSASVVVRELAGLPIDLTYFIGELDRFANGSLFADTFGTDSIASDVRGSLYFPTGVAFDGIHAVNGTGISIASSVDGSSVYLDGSFYQDGYLGAGRYSADVRAAFNTPDFKFESFVGATFPAGSVGIYRGGMLIYYGVGGNIELLAEIGIPRFAPITDGVPGIDDLFILLEPRAHIGIMDVAMTLFWHPSYYLQEPTGEDGATDIFMRVTAGDANEDIVSAGLEGAVHLNPVNVAEPLRVDVSPILRLNAGGASWDFKVTIKALPFSLSDFFEAQVGVRTQL